MSDSFRNFFEDIVREFEEAVCPENSNLVAEGPSIQLAWNNYYGSWSDGGWNNYYGSWSDGGWNNYYGSWSDGGWNNYYGSWSDGGWNNYYGSWGDGSSGSSGGGGGCFLTTACVEHKGLADDCYELQTLRAIRDTVVTWSDEMKDLVKEYYRVAPEIVSKINAEENSADLWEDLYVNLVQKCVSLYENNDIEGALNVYIRTVKVLMAKYCEG